MKKLCCGMALCALALGCGNVNTKSNLQSDGASDGTAASDGSDGSNIPDAGCATTDASCGGPGDTPAASGDPCAIKSIRKLGTAYTAASPDGKKVMENRKDGNGVYQVFIGTAGVPGSAVCISCTQGPGGPKPTAHKFMTIWHPSSQWIFVGGEIAHDRLPFVTPEQDEGMLETGVNLNMYIAKPDGSAWYRLTNFENPTNPGGYVGPAMTPDGKRAYWTPIVDGNIFVYTFGKWRLMVSDLVFDGAGVPSLRNTADITPPATNWLEPGNVSPDGKSLLLSMDTGLASNKAAGQDQWIMDLQTHQLTALMNTPDEWDEHGIFAPNGKKVVFMSSHPFPDYKASTSLFGVVGLHTEFMLIDVDGSHLRQLTHFNQPGYPESQVGVSIAAVAYFNPDGSQLIATQLPPDASFQHISWLITFAGRCGGDGGF